MRPGTDQPDFVVRYFVYEYPIGRDVAVPVPLPVSLEWVRAGGWSQGLALLNGLYHRLKLFEIVPPPRESFEVSLECAGRPEGLHAFRFKSFPSTSSNKSLVVL